MNRDDLVHDLADRFDSRRSEFVGGVKADISDYIADSGPGCLTLVDESGTRWELAASPAYVKRLIALCKGDTYRGEKIDSGLTQPIVAIVSNRFHDLYRRNDSDITEAVLDLITSDNRLAANLAETIVDSALPPGSILRERLTDLLLAHIHHFLSSSTGSTVSATLGKSVGSSASGPIAAKIASLIVTSFSTQLKLYVGKMLATGAIKSTVAVAVKKFLIYAIAAALVKAIAIKFGVVLTASTFMWVLLPVIAIFIVHEVYTFPKHLAKSVSNKLADDLSGKYRSINLDVFGRLVTTLLEEGTHAIAQSVAQDEEVQSMLQQLHDALDSDTPSPDETDSCSDH